MATGYFKLYRPIRNHWVYSDSRYLHLWLDCLINARWSDEPKTEVYKGVMYTVNRGQFLFSRSTYSKRLNIEEAVVRKAIELMVKDGMIEQVGSLGKNKPTLYAVCNFDKYNPLNDSEPPNEPIENEGLEGFSAKSKPSGDQVETQSKPSGNPVATTKEECNKGNKEKKVKKEIIIKEFSPIPNLNQAILDFIEFRKNIKKPMTDRAVTLMMNELNKLTINPDEQIAILNQSIINGWQGVFPLKQNHQHVANTQGNKIGSKMTFNDQIEVLKDWANDEKGGKF